MARSILGQLLPEAMVAYLENHGPERFATIFLGEYDTPEAIWCTEMRQLMIQKIAYHLADFTPRLQSNNRAVYQYCAIPLITFPSLEHDLFCDIYYLRNLCNTSKFPSWPITQPVSLLKEVLGAWRLEVEKVPSTMTVDDAYSVLGLAMGSQHEDSTVRKAYFRLAQKYHPDKNPNGRDMFEKVNTAYEFLCSKSARVGSGPDPNNIVLILRTQSILFDRHSEELHPYKYAGYPMLIKTIQLESEDSTLFSKTAPLLAAAAEVAYYTVRCSNLNAEELRREQGLEALFVAFERCVGVLSASSAPTDVAVEVGLLPPLVTPTSPGVHTHREVLLRGRSVPRLQGQTNRNAGAGETHPVSRLPSSTSRCGTSADCCTTSTSPPSAPWPWSVWRLWRPTPYCRCTCSR